MSDVQRHARELLSQAKVLPPGERWAYVVAKSDDPGVRAEVERLLAQEAPIESGSVDPTVELSDSNLSERLADSQTSDLIGQTISHYQIVDKLGAGGMGVVYRAMDERLSRGVALKFLPAGVKLDSRAHQRFTREARATSALNHPNIVTIHEIAAVGSLPFIVMELVEGQTLRAMLAEGIPLESLRDLGLQAARALAIAHDAGIVHRDIKPENLMVRNDGYVKILDFGLARLVPARFGVAEGLADAGETGAGVILGTIRYMSPEQTQGETLGPASDVFSLGIVLYELATGRHPFSADSHQAIMRHIVSEMPLPPSRLNAEVSGHLECLILEMLQKDPQLRPTAGEVEKRLAEFSVDQLAASTPGQVSFLPSGIERHTVGRGDVIAALEMEFQAAIAGQGRFVCIAGEPGLGKTTLLDDLLQKLNASGNGCSVARGTCSERLAGAEAYLPIIEVLENLTRHDRGGIVARTLRQLAPTWYVRVVSLSTDDASAERVLADANTASQERMKREMIAFLEELCRTRPVVLFLEDVHWSDVSTVDLLAYIGTKLDAMRLLIVATYRPTELLQKNHVFARVKLELQGRGRCHELVLDFLSRKDIDEYLSLEFPGHRFPIEFAELIHARTEGSPLFMVDLLRFLQDRGVIGKKATGWELLEAVAEIEDEIPESVRSMVQKKIDQLGDDDRRLLTAASVQGQVFEAAVVAGTLERDEAEVEERLECLDRLHALVRPVGEYEFPDQTLTLRYTFVHALYQNSLYGALSPVRRARTSKLVARTLVDLYGKQSPTIASELALLFEAAREFGPASSYFAVAARNAASIYANQEAVELTRKAIANAEKLDGRQRDKRIRSASIQLGRLYMTLSRFEDALASFRQAEASARDCGDTKSEIKAICSSGAALLYLKRVEETVAEAERALELARANGSDDCVASAEMLLGNERLCMGALSVAEESFRRAAPVLKSQGSPIEALEAVASTGMIHAWRLEYDEAHRILDWTVQRSRELGACFPMLRSLFFKSMTLGNQGRLSDAIESLTEGMRVAELNGERFWLSRFPNTLGWIHREAQDFESALKLDRENVALAQEIGAPEGEANSLVNLGHDLLSLGEADRAFEHFQQAAKIYEQDVWYRWRYNTRMQAELARYWILRGSLEPAASHASACLKAAESTQSHKYIAWAHKVLGDVASLEDRVDDAAREYGIALQVADAHPCPTTQWRILAARAELARKLKDSSQAEQFRGLAKNVVQGLADSIREEPLRQKFMNSEAIREL